MDFKGVFSTDKLLHASFSFVLTVAITAIFTFQPERLVIGAIGALLFGIGKEVYDKLTYKPDWRDQLFDFGFDIIGIVCALLSLTALGL